MANNTDNNIYRKISKGVSLDELLKGVPALPPAGETLLPSAVSPPAGLEEKTQPLESSEKAMDQRAAAFHKLFADIHLYRKFRKSDFGNFRFPFFKKLNKLDYAQLVASGTAQRVALTLKSIRGIERAGDTSVYLQEVSNIGDLTSLLSFSHVPYDNAPAEWLVIEYEVTVTKRFGLYQNKDKVGAIYYVLPHVKIVDRIALPDIFGTRKQTYHLGGMGIIYSGSSIKDEKHNSDLDYNLGFHLHGFFPKKIS